MIRHFSLAICLTGTALTVAPAHACLPMLAEPRLPNENDEAYRVRTGAVERERATDRLHARQAVALQDADAIFIARDTPWSPPAKTRRGRPALIRLPQFPYSLPIYFEPVDWFRGPQSKALLRVSSAYTSCGPMSIGDTTFSQVGSLYVFFAHKGPLSEKMLIDAIAVDRIDDPALMEFVAKYRGKSPPDPTLSR